MVAVLVFGSVKKLMEKMGMKVLLLVG